MEYRTMKLSDLFTIGDMERRIFNDPWSVSSCRGALDNPCVHAVVAEDDDGIAGYGFIMGTQDEAEILRVAVDPEKRRQHIGSGLMDELLDFGDSQGYSSVFLEVRESNSAALGLYEKCGFETIGKRVDYYRNPVEDAVIMELVYTEEEE